MSMAGMSAARMPTMLLLALILACGRICGAEAVAPSPSADGYVTQVRPLVQTYCSSCHSADKHKGGLNLVRFESITEVRRDVAPWEHVVEMLEAGEMPPEGKKQPTADERRLLLEWTHGFLNDEARARAGDPGFVPLRRLSNAEYSNTVRDLTRVGLDPAKEFPADGAAGEGFTNAAEALADMSPTLLNKYLLAAKAIAAHAVLLPDGFRFSTGDARRDWTNECMESIRQFYAEYTPDADGRLPLEPYLRATLRYREALTSGQITLESVAVREKLNAKYLGILWQALTDPATSFPLSTIRSRWLTASEKDTGALLAEISRWQDVLWKFVKIGSYRDGNTARQVANDPPVVQSQTLKLDFTPVPGTSDVVLYLVARDLMPGGGERYVTWKRPRFEAANRPALLLSDYAQFGPRYEVDYPAIFADSAKYLAAAVEAANDKKLTVEDLAKKHGLNADLARRWFDVLALDPFDGNVNDPGQIHGRSVPAAPLKLLEEMNPRNEQKPAIEGWKRKGGDLPVAISNSSDKVEQVPGKVSPHRVTVHPTPTEYVAAVWKSPVSGLVRVSASVTHVHPACGNGIAWWLEYRRADRATRIAEGAIDVGGAATVPARDMRIAEGDELILAVDARDGNHVCDLTEINLSIAETGDNGRTWNLAGDVADNILQGNPHADRLGNKDVWRFVEGPSAPPGTSTAQSGVIPANSVLARWREAATDRSRQDEAGKLAEQVQSLLSGKRPDGDKDPDRLLYDKLVSPGSPLFQGVDLSAFPRVNSGTKPFGLDRGRFGPQPADKAADETSIVARAGSVAEIRLPAALLAGRQFVVDATADQNDGVYQFQVLTAPPPPVPTWDGKGPLVSSPSGDAFARLIRQLDQFRQCFPVFICYPHIIPVDEVVCLKQYHREDELLGRLFLDDAQQGRLDRLWEEHRFISQWPVAENDYLPLFIGFTTQDQPKELTAYYEGMREPFRKRAEAFNNEVEAATPRQLDALLRFASRAFRRPLRDDEKASLTSQYKALRAKGVPGDEAFRGVLTRVLVSPSFLFRMEEAPPGKKAGPVNDYELATRLSYFLWSTFPDEELTGLAAEGKLRDPSVLAQQARRMLKDDRVRSLAVEFGTQWIHVRDFLEFNEKNEKLFPTFDAGLRSDIYEESVRFFQDLFQNDEPVTCLIDADYTYLNESLARHYGIPGVAGPQWRKVDGVKQYGRGGVLALASVLSKEAGASRTSPILRGNWIVETLLGEKLPRPPPDVPKVADEQAVGELTMRQIIEKHTQTASCAVCHQRIDPFGFSLERYDAIGRARDKETNRQPIDCQARLKDGTEFNGIDGLRTYLLSKKKDVIVRLFCRRLLGYALGRSVTLSDQTLIDDMMAELEKSHGHVDAAVLAIVRSPQFNNIRGSDYDEEE
jgi:mono/diheme cytochrome c family protein